MDTQFVGVSFLNLIFFSSGWIFFSRVLYREYEVNNIFVQLIFCCVFTISCSMFELIIFEIVGVLDHDMRWMNWKVDLISMLTLLVFVVPYYIFYLILKDYVSVRRMASPMAFGLLCIFLYCFWTIGDPFPILTKSHGIFSIEQGISRIAILGTWVMAVLAGYGAVSCPFAFISAFIRKIDEQEVNDLKLRLPVVQQQIALKKRWIVCRRMELENSKRSNSGDRKGGSSMARRALSWIPVVGNAVEWMVPSSDAATEQKIMSLQNEVRGLEALSIELFLEMNELLEYRERIAFSRTLEGRFLNTLGYVFAAYCVYKVIMTTVNIILRRVGKIDPISRGIWIVNIILNCIEDGSLQHCLSDNRPTANQIDEEFWSQTLSFVISGVLIFVTIRGFMKNFVMRIFQDFSSGATANIIILLLVETMGMYFVSAVVLMRMNMPIRYRAIITDVLGDIHFNFYQRWFDLIFWIASMVTIGWQLYHHHKRTNRVKMF